MAFKISKNLQFPQSTLQYIPQAECNLSLTRGLPLLGGVLSDTRYVWHAKGPCLEVRNTKTGTKVGAWTFGCILKDSNTKVVCVDEVQRLNGRLSLLAVGIECTISGGLICIFDVFGSKVIRAIQIKDKISTLHVVDSGCEVLNLPGPLRNFDGIIAVGTEGGNVFLVDICRQICEEALYVATVRDELYPCKLILLTLKDIPKIEYYKEQSVREGDHLAIHLNVVFHSQTEHFTLKGPQGDDRIHVNKEEVVTSALSYCSQLTSLLIGFNFGAFQLWDLTTLKLVYTSPVCDEHSPITHFALQEPADDPRAFCYIWVSYSNSKLFETGLPFAVMYSVCYDTKEFHEGYGYLYQDFQSCSVRFQVELGQLEEHKSGSKARGGRCIGLQPVCKVAANKEFTHDITGDTLALCAISWTVWFNQSETQSYFLVFDLNQWYKEQMPHFTKGSDCSNYILKVGISDLVTMTGHKGGPLLDIKMDKKTLRQFSGVQRLEEHFCPTALSFDLWVLKETGIVLLHNDCLQQALLNQIEAAGPLCLIRPSDIYRQIITLGLSPLFMDISMNIPVSTDLQREIILNVGLEHRLIGWLCRCASEWANGSFSSAGCSLDFLMHWGFQRALLLKSYCDKYCMPLFDYSQSRLDHNTSILFNSCTRQINNLCTLYSYVTNRLSDFISNLELIMEQYTSLKMVSMYFEVLQWLANVGLLPECHPSTYPRPDNTERISAPYPVQELTEYYNKKRAQLQLLTKETFVSSDSLLFIDNLITNKCGAEQLQQQWQEDGGSGLYPPPSLQSMLRTYLIEGADISHKHSLIIYVFLDLAMALDQSRYASVITHLIKFPAVFKVSSSIIKITQAFWQLDHGDYTTAMEQLLDPFVLSDDLQPWHHAIAMRALLLQNQYNFALLYMQVRRPPISDEKDVLTAISLFIANNMLDEAFYFKNQHNNNNNEERLLMHLFNECNKNESLHALLYRCLNTNEEKAFFKYLKSVENPSLGDLQVFYYLMRSRFVEAFDAHQNSKRSKPECQGLIGQRNATRTDQIVRIFKTLLPDINKKLVDVVQRERTNLWKEVATTRPTPLSVFVHNTNEQIKYKSTVIQAALAKAKHTFNDSTNGSKFKEVITEETPFLRTPKASRTNLRHNTPVITPKVIEINEFGEEMVPSPCKKLKLTPRTSTTSPTWNRSLSIHSKMLTPIVKRKTFLRKDDSLSTSNINVCTPQSILKVRNLVRRSDTIPDDSNVSDMLEDYEGAARIENSTRKSGLGLLPRKSLSRNEHRPHVQFDDAARFSSSISEQSIKSSHNNTTLEGQSLDKSTLSSKDISHMVSSKNSSTSNTSNTDVFYSPNASINELSKSEEENSGVSSAPSHAQNEEVFEEIIPDKDQNKLSEHVSSISQSPRARRSYKRSLGESLPIRTSSRITRSSSMQSEKSGLDETNDKIISNKTLEAPEILKITDSNEESGVELSQTQSPTPRLLQKVKARKSLNRKVLEHNTLSKMKSSPLLSKEAVTKEISLTKMERTVVTEKTLNSSEVTTIETKMDVCNTSTINPDSSQSHTSSSSVFKRKLHDLYRDNDTLMDSDISFDTPELPESLRASDSLLEYMKSRTRRYDDNESLCETNKTQSEEPEGIKVHTKHYVKVTRTLEGSTVHSEPIEVYEDLSSADEDIEEGLTASRLQTDNYKPYGESLNYPESTSNQFSKGYNIASRPTSDSCLRHEKSDGASSCTTSQDQSDDGSSKTEPSSLNQCPKLLPKVKGRKSLTRQVLEHNTLSRMMATTPNSSDLISQDASAPTMEERLNTPESKTRSNHDLSNTSVSEGCQDVDTSVDSNIFDSPKLPDSLKMSDSLAEYMKSRFGNRDNVITFTRTIADTPDLDDSISKDEALSSKAETSLNTSESKAPSSSSYRTSSSGFEGHMGFDTLVDANIFDSPKLPDSLKMSDSLAEYMKSRFGNRDNVITFTRTIDDTPDLDDSISKGEACESKVEKSFDTSESKTPSSRMSDALTEYMKSKAAKYENVQSEDPQKHPNTSVESKCVYEDLSSGAEDIEEVLTANKHQKAESKVYTSLSNCFETAYDELEKNIFQTSSRGFGEDISHEIEPNISGITSYARDSLNVPEADKAFILSPSMSDASVLSANSYLSEANKGFLADDPTPTISKQSEVIEISSSSDEEDSSKTEHSGTNDSRSSVKSDSDVDDLNISYERNIHVEVDSEASAASEGHLSEPNADENGQADERQNMVDNAYGSNSGSEVEINEDDSSVEYMNNDDQESEEGTEPPPVFDDVECLVSKGEEAEKDESYVVIESEPENLVGMEGTMQIAVASEEVEKVEEGGIETEDKITSETNKETSNLQGKGNTDKTVNYDCDAKVSLHVEVPIAEIQESGREVVPEVSQKESFVDTETDHTDKLQVDESCGKEMSDLLKNEKSIETNEEIDQTSDHSKQLLKETTEQQTNASSAILKDETALYGAELEKKNQSTNTTILSDAVEVVELKQIIVRVEQSTNTTAVFISDKDESLPTDHSVPEADGPTDKRVAHPKQGATKVISEERTLSSVSSDTTEGESSSQAITVTAQVHTASTKSTETPSLKRSSRRNSSKLCQAAEPVILDASSEPDMSMDVSEYDIIDNTNNITQTPLIKAHVTDILEYSNFEADDSTKVTTPGRRTRRSRSASTTPTRVIKTRRSSIVDKSEQSEPIKNDPKRELIIPIRRTRSASVDEVTPPSRKRSLRSSSIDEKVEDSLQDHKPKTKGKAMSVMLMPIISEESKERSKAGRRSKSSSTVEAYATTRRLTRRQASLVKGIQTPSSVTAQDDSDAEKSLEIDAIDPIILLDKEPFQGKPDPEEEKVYEPSPSPSPSNSTASSFNKPTKRISRSASVASDSSLSPSISQPTTPRRTRQSAVHMDSPSPSGLKARLRKKSETSSIASEKSDPPTPKRSRKKYNAKDADGNNSDISVALSTRSTRSRANSVSSIQSDTSNSVKRATRSRRLVSTKSDLPEITEEKAIETENASGKAAPKRQTRRK